MAEASAISGAVTGASRLVAAWKSRGSQTTSSLVTAAAGPKTTRSLGLSASERAKRVTAGATAW